MSVLMKRGISFLYAFLYVYLIYSICTILLRVGFEGAAGDIFFFTLSIYLCIPFIKYNKMKNTIITGSIEGNYKVNREVEKLKDKANIMEGLILKNDGEDFEIDNIVITNKGVFNIVKCDYKGDFEVRNNNRWYKINRNDSREVISPITEVRKNRAYLAKIFDEDRIIDLIVMVNDRVFIEGEENSDAYIVRYDELYNYINEYHIEEEIDADEIYDKIYEKIIKTRDINEEKILYNNFIDNIWAFRSRLIFISVFFIVYILNIVYMQRA